MSFLIDEDIPVKLLKSLKELGHNALRVRPSSSDITIANQAKANQSILISLDNDFSNTKLFPPEKFDIILLRIHPPYEGIIVETVKKFLATVPAEKIKGLTILTTEGHVRFV